MPKNAPSVGRILTMVIFTLSCFGLLLFLWLSFGGPIPLQPEGYRFRVAFPEAATLAEEADVRIAGVNVGKVKTKELDAGAARTIVELELEDEYAPVPEDTRAILRQKTLLGETYVELTPGDPATGMLAEGGRLDDSSVEETVELDEILRIFSPRTKEAFRAWVDESAKSIDGGTSQDLSDAIGNLPEFSESGTDVLQVLDEQEVAVRQLVRNTGVVFGALNEQEGALRDLIVNSERTFEATASEKDALAETIQIFPTFLRESRLTLDRLETFSRDTRPLVNDLKPVADDLGPTVRDLGDLAPNLESVFHEFKPLIRSSRTTLPDAARFIRGAEPVLESAHRFLPELNPVIAFANFYRGGLAEFWSGGGPVTLNGGFRDPGAPTDLRYLPQTGLLGANSFHFGRNEQGDSPSPVSSPSDDTNEEDDVFRANSYNKPGNVGGIPLHGIIPSFDCSQVGGIQQRADPGQPSPPNPPPPVPPQPPCVTQGDYGWDGGLYPQVKGRIPPLVGGRRIPSPRPFPARPGGPG